MPHQENVHHARSKVVRIGKTLGLVLIVLLSLLVLPLGGLILIGLGVYIGTLAHRARALPAADPSAPARRFFGRKPSYGLSAVCTVTGILVFISGVAVFSNSAPPKDQVTPAGSAPAAPAALPAQPAASPQPVLTQPPADSAPLPAPAAPQTQATNPIKAPEKPVQPQPVVSRPPQPVVSRPAAPQPIAPKPVEPQPIAPQPVEPQPDSGSGAGAAYYRNCTEARAAGAAPLHRGDPGYREELDRDHDGTACETTR